jgi:hypothetical protein
LISSDVVAKFQALETKIALDRGDFVLFALFGREDVPDRWDLIVSAPWASPDDETALEYMLSEIKKNMGQEDLTSLSRIVFVDPYDRAVESLNRAIHTEHGSVEVRDTNFFGLPIKHAFIITSKKPAVPVKS